MSGAGARPAASSTPDAELPDPVAKAVMALPGQAFPVLLLVLLHGEALLAVAASAAAADAGGPIGPLHRFPEGQGPDPCHLVDQAIHCLHLQEAG